MWKKLRDENVGLGEGYLEGDAQRDFEGVKDGRGLEGERARKG